MAPRKKVRLLEGIEGKDANLAKLLLHKWAWGLYSAFQVFEIADKSLKDQNALLERLGLSTSFASPSLQILAGIGGEGKHPSNMRRDLLTALGDPQVPEFVSIEAPLNIAKPDAGAAIVQNVSVPMFLPHEFLSYLYHYERDSFNTKLLGPSKDTVSFWKELEKRGDPRLQGHPMKSSAD